jgi:pyridoxamine 5'-phosphate oxidase
MCLRKGCETGARAESLTSKDRKGSTGRLATANLRSRPQPNSSVPGSRFDHDFVTARARRTGASRGLPSASRRELGLCDMLFSAMAAFPLDPIDRFNDAFQRAQGTEAHDGSAVALATADASGGPSVRMVLLRGVDARGFVFFTNRGSRKALEIAANSRAALCFYWPRLDEQVRVEGAVELVKDEESDAYFASRPRGSQIGAWASKQSTILASREDLEAAAREVEERFAGVPVPRPPFWGGYRVVPASIEFWRAGANRLHERVRYDREGTGWRTALLSP